ncbi:hypothetical protein ACRAWD_00865 [Caulobacter segnis]
MMWTVPTITIRYTHRTSLATIGHNVTSAMAMATPIGSQRGPRVGAKSRGHLTVLDLMTDAPENWSPTPRPGFSRTSS